MCVDKPKAAKDLSAQRVVGKFRDKYPLCISNNDMVDTALPVNENAYLTADRRGALRYNTGKIS